MSSLGAHSNKTMLSLSQKKVWAIWRIWIVIPLWMLAWISHHICISGNHQTLSPSHSCQAWSKLWQDKRFKRHVMKRDTQRPPWKISRQSSNFSGREHYVRVRRFVSSSNRSRYVDTNSLASMDRVNQSIAVTWPSAQKRTLTSYWRKSKSMRQLPSM